MWRYLSTVSRVIFLFLATSAFFVAPFGMAEAPTPHALSAFSLYTLGVESRLVQQHRSYDHFIVMPASSIDFGARLHRGEMIIERLTSVQTPSSPGALIHHWRGTVFIAGATAPEMERLLRTVEAYPAVYTPEVTRARATVVDTDRLRVWMRVRQRHVLTVVLDMSYDMSLGRLDVAHGYSQSASTKIADIGAPETAAERALSADEEHGFLWCQNTYWSFAERDGGLYVQVESVSLTRAIPLGLAWAVRPYVESVPRESLEFTLQATGRALGK